LGYESTVTGWVDTTKSNGKFGEDYVYRPGTADTHLPKFANPANYDDGELWGPHNHVNNGLPASSPAGGNFVSLTGGQNATAFTQTISALQTGHTYVLTFDYAFAQGYGAQVAGSKDFLSVSLGSQTQSTPTFVLPAKGFSGWGTETFTFKNFTGPDTLSFLAHGMIGAPPYALLDGVSLTGSGVPEPAGWVMMLIGFAGIGGAVRHRARAIS
jgi:hypothetical protein